MLRRYDTLIIDEAHERSLNIDFILGYLRQLLPRRPDLQGDRHVGDDRHRALRPALRPRRGRRADRRGHRAHVPGRGALPAVRRRARRRPRPGAGRHRRRRASSAREGRGDVLVFLSGEREIHDTADALARLERPRHSRCCRCTPGCRRPSSTASSSPTARRVVLAPTSPRRRSPCPACATSSTPARRASPATAAASRSNDCRSSRSRRRRRTSAPVAAGASAPGICIRLYGEDDFARPPGVHRARDPAHQPRVGHPADDGASASATSPRSRSSSRPTAPPIRDGYLPARGARRDRAAGRRRVSSADRDRPPAGPPAGRPAAGADGARGRAPRLRARGARDRRGAVDPGRPRAPRRNSREAADELHRRFDVAGSDLLSIVALWDHLREQQRALSANQFRRLCRSEYLNYLRVREWQDLFSQLRQAAGSLGMQRQWRRRPPRPRPPGGARRPAVAPRHAATGDAARRVPARPRRARRRS